MHNDTSVIGNREHDEGLDTGPHLLFLTPMQLCRTLLMMAHWTAFARGSTPEQMVESVYRTTVTDEAWATVHLPALEAIVEHLRIGLSGEHAGLPGAGGDWGPWWVIVESCAAGPELAALTYAVALTTGNPPRTIAARVYNTVIGDAIWRADYLPGLDEAAATIAVPGEPAR